MGSELMPPPIEVPADWDIVRLKDICLKIGSGATPTGGQASYLDRRETYALVRSQNVYDRHFSHDGLAYISDDQAARLKGVELREGDILLNITGDGITFGRACQVDKHCLPACVNQHVSIIRVDPSKASASYILAFLTHPVIKEYIESFNAGGSRRAITKGHIESFVIPIPPMQMQDEIGEVLLGFDNKVALLRETNATLEAIAQAIFKSWFVDFEPVCAKTEGNYPEGMPPEVADLFPSEFEESELGAIPKGWRVRTVEELAERVGMGPFGSNIKVSTFVEEGVPVISGKHLHGTLLEDSTFNYISEEHAQRLSGSMVGEGDVVFTHAGNIGQVALVPKKAKFDRYVLSQRQFFLRCNRSLIPPTWMTHFFRSPGGQHLLLANASQVGVPSIARPVSYLKSIKMVAPPPHIAHAFDDTAQALIAKIVNGKNEVQSLTDLRDTLLPRLMSGKMRLKEVEGKLGEHL